MAMQQERLFRLAHEHIGLVANHHPGRGWTLEVRARRQDEGWDEAQRECYQQLSTAELVDTIEATLLGLFG